MAKFINRSINAYLTKVSALCNKRHFAYNTVTDVANITPEVLERSSLYTGGGISS